MAKVVSNEKGISGSQNHTHRIVAFITKTKMLIHSSNYIIKLQSLFHFLHFPLFISQLFCFFLTFLVGLPFIAKDCYHTKLLQHSEKWALATIMNRTRMRKRDSPQIYFDWMRQAWFVLGALCYRSPRHPLSGRSSTVFDTPDSAFPFDGVFCMM